ncbi:MAG TPA: hypothetical protein PLV05_04420 [Verrucomicrobiota bacterium]|jgi:hypothetical protein|nr:hypothetical protein [Verrucomicrobiota bacterium]HRR63557.1 hypothetical protein [Candidatus Paceibacterota bacterium]NLH85288.1 hypothetical protein [Verrucomicrobiota bacterium]HOF70113.1 hypothetical protein [Verrucomicrobiota bacterium]HOM44372.1 hypothetical protein [Verrucomicrobiota bacterium]
MITQKRCPFCQTPAVMGCPHLAIAVEGRDFVRRCVELCQGQKQWRALAELRQRQRQATGEWTPERDDYTWLETAFCEEFLKPLSWFGGLEHEWRIGPKGNQAGFLVLLWSKDPRRLWWQLRDELERQAQEPFPGKRRKVKGQSPRASRRDGDLRLL